MKLTEFDCAFCGKLGKWDSLICVDCEIDGMNSPIEEVLCTHCMICKPMPESDICSACDLNEKELLTIRITCQKCNKEYVNSGFIFCDECLTP